MTATTVVTMTPSDDKDNEDGNNNNTDKATRTMTMTTEGGGAIDPAETMTVGGFVVPGPLPLRRDDAFVESSSKTDSTHRKK